MCTFTFYLLSGVDNIPVHSHTAFNSCFPGVLVWLVSVLSLISHWSVSQAGKHPLHWSSVVISVQFLAEYTVLILLLTHDFFQNEGKHLSTALLIVSVKK